MTYDLQLVRVGKVYDNGTPAVIDFNLEVSKGEFIAFLGPSGCGKTTTLRMIAGFESITSGDILIRGGRFFSEFTPARLAGSSLGGSFLKLRGIYVGFSLEIHFEKRLIITSRVRKIAVPVE